MKLFGTVVYQEDEDRVIVSIEHNLKIKGEMIAIQHLLDYCVEKCINFKVEDDTRVYLNDWEMWIYFLESRQPYNVWECSAFDMHFKYDATIFFELGKNPDYWEMQEEFVLEYVFKTMKELKREGLFLYCMDTELCYFRADGSIQINDENGILKNVK